MQLSIRTQWERALLCNTLPPTANKKPVSFQLTGFFVA